MMFVDSSVIVAILAEESDWQDQLERIQSATPCFTSAMVIVESGMRLSSLHKIDPSDVERDIRDLLLSCQVEIIPITSLTATLALKAFSKYGKGRGHPAQLNLGDCLSYGSAKEQRVGLLYKGNDFAQTDMA
jgi:ribonuclease VapC